MVPPTPPRNQARSGRPYPSDIVAGVRALVEGAGLSHREAAARSGLREDTIGRWARRFGWRRAERGGALSLPASRACPTCVLLGAEIGNSRLRRGEGRVEAQLRAGVGTARPGETPPRSAVADSPSPPGREKRNYGAPPELREAARVRIEGSRDGLERIANELGIARWTLHRWRTRFGWQRPAPPDTGGLGFYRSRRLGRAYGGDAVGMARDLVTGSILPLGRIATQAGVSRATLYRWMKRPGWARHPAGPGGRYRPPYPPEAVAAARELYRTTELSTRIIAARVKTTPERVAHWARTKGWSRPREPDDPPGRVRRRRRAAAPRASATR